MKRLPILFAVFVLAAVSCLAQAPASQFGSHNYVEYIPGDLPLILSSPHGGALKPEGMPDRAYGVTGSDMNTQELTRFVAEEIFRRSGHRPHLILSHLHRSKLDPNREIGEAAQGNQTAIKAWEEYHAFIETACRTVLQKHEAAFFIDMHGQNHKGERIELGYLHTPAELAQSAEILNSPAFVAKSSLALLVQRTKLPYTEVLRGSKSLAAMLEAQGYSCTPGPRLPVPDEPYFKGGYTVARHCKGQTTGLQLEANRSRIRDTTANQKKFAAALTTVLEDFLRMHLNISLR